MSILQSITSLLIRVLSHNSTQTVLKHLARQATVELIRHIQRHTKSRQPYGR